MPKKGCLGCSFPLTVGILVVVIGLFVIGLISGALGNAIMGETSIGEVVAIEQPHIQLPAETIFHIGGFEVTNTLITSWISIIVLVLISWVVTRKIKIIPSRLQALLLPLMLVVVGGVVALAVVAMFLPMISLLNAFQG